MRLVTAREQYIMAMPWYHNTDADLASGDEIVPAAESGYESRWSHLDDYDPSVVYVSKGDRDEDARSDLGSHRYEVEPVGRPGRDPGSFYGRDFPHDWADEESELPSGYGYTVPRARVVRKLPGRTAMPMMYHRTDPDSAKKIYEKGFNGGDWDTAYLSDQPNGEADRYGEGLVTLNIPDDDFEHLKGEGYLDRTFPEGASDEDIKETHWAVPASGLKREWYVHPEDGGRTAKGRRRHAIQQPHPGLKLQYHPDQASVDAAYGPGEIQAPAVTAEHPDSKYQPTGYLQWDTADHPERPNTISWVDVDPDFRRQGIGDAMWNHAKQFNPDIVHSEQRSMEGDDWAHAVGGHIPPLMDEEDEEDW